ncbi:TetR/AcrR family transcriptional regulator [Mesorhizobium cantuariense]|uniref:TetR/AcrR family transcriptional regulator n=1 Tax=Mesorhizobium cantuariense TaxID=1300275 RepID=A0ABV7MV15_9HYPH
MTERSIDRRVARTRGMLQHALISLILKKGYEAITIEDICEAANVGRSTFYAHYTSKDDLKKSGLDENLRRLLVDRQKDALAMPGNSKDRHLAFSLPMFEHARDHLDLYRALAGGHGGGVSFGSIRQILSDVVRGELSTTVDKTSANAVPDEFIVQYVVGAYMAVLTWWLDRGAKPPPVRVDAMFRRLATDGILPLLAESSSHSPNLRLS